MTDTIRPTRYADLGYRLDGPSCWRLYGEGAAIGTPYATKAELLADLEREARERGYSQVAGAPIPHPLPEDVREVIRAMSTDTEIIASWLSIGDPHRNRLRELSSQAMQVRNRHNF